MMSRTPQSVLIAQEQIPTAGEVLARAFFNDPLLQRADQEGLPCYLETFGSQNVPFYEHRGFQVVYAGVEPQSQLAFWAMKREPHAAKSTEGF